MPCEMSAHYFVCHVCTCFLGLARTLCIRCMYGIFGREITRYTVICGAYIWFWPTLIFLCATSAQNFLCHVYTCFCVPCLHMFLYATSAHYVRHISLVCGTSVACLHVCTFCVPCLHMCLCAMFTHVFVCHVCTLCEAHQPGLWHICGMSALLHILRAVSAHVLVCHVCTLCEAHQPRLWHICGTSARLHICTFCVPCLHMFLCAMSAHVFACHVCTLCEARLHVCTFCVPCLHMCLCAMFTHVLCAMSAHVFMCHVCTLCEARQPGLWHICGMSARLHILRAMTAHVLVCHIVDACMNYACMMYGDSICKTIETCVYRDVPLPVFH